MRELSSGSIDDSVSELRPLKSPLFCTSNGLWVSDYNIIKKNVIITKIFHSTKAQWKKKYYIPSSKNLRRLAGCVDTRSESCKKCKW